MNRRRAFIARLALLILPLALLSISILLLTSVVFYFDGKQQSLASKSENFFLEMAFKNTQVKSINQKIAVVSVTDSDFNLVRHSPGTPLKEADLLEYSEVLKQVLKRDPELVVLSVLAQAHLSEEQYFSTLFATLNNSLATKKVIFALPHFLINQFSTELKDEFIFKEATDCKTKISIACSITSETILGYLVGRFAKINGTITRNLPVEGESLAMRLPILSDSQFFSFSDLKDEQKRRQIPSGAIVFIGNSTQQDFLFRENRELLQRSFVAGESNKRSLIVDGVPWHEQWARMAQMLIDGSQIKVVSKRVETGIILWLVMIIFVTAWKWRSLAFGSFFLGCVLLPLGNILGIRFFAVYLPLVNIIFWGTFSFVLISFASITHNSILKRVIKFRKQRGDFHADIKYNFLSVVSHNVNTPIAQIKGIFDAFFRPSDFQYEHLAKNIETMNIAAKMTLTSSKANAEVAMNCSVNALIKTFIEHYVVFFSRLNWHLTASLILDDDLKDERFQSDEHTVAIILFCAVVVLTRQFGGAIEIHCHRRGEDLHVTFQFIAADLNLKEAFLTDAALHLLGEFEKAGKIQGMTSLTLTSVQPSIAFPNLFFRGENSALRIASKTR